MNVLKCGLFVSLFFLSAVLPVTSAAQDAPAPKLKTRNVILIVVDGLRWQEVFTGADPELLNGKYGGIWDNEQDLRRQFWRESSEERRKALFPFLWSKVAVEGQIFGNQAQRSIARVTNGKAFSYPGYNEMLTGFPDPQIDSNEFGKNPNRTVFEWLDSFPELHGSAAIFATWSAFKDIFNISRSHLPIQAGWDLPYHGSLTARQDLVNRMYQTTTKLDQDDVYDSFLQLPLLDALQRDHPRLLFVGYGEPDDWAHAGRYDLVLQSSHHFDQFVEEIWTRIQGIPEYRGQTTLLITTDHGRGSGLTEWKDHGTEEKGSENIWLAVIGPDTAPLGERKDAPLVEQAQIAGTIAAFFGKDYRHAVPAAAPPITGVFSGAAASKP